MEEVYELHQHTHCVVMHIGKTTISTRIFSTSNRHFTDAEAYIAELDTTITYNEHKTNFTCFRFEEGEENIVVDNFRDRLYKLFKKEKEEEKEFWDEEDKFLMKAVSDYLPLVIEYIMEAIPLEIESFDLLHYAFIVPSEWEEGIRDDIIRPIFVQSGLISKQDHQDRLLFFTDIESLCYKHDFKRKDNTILCRLLNYNDENIIKFDLIQTTNSPFNFPNAKLFPKVTNSNAVPNGIVEQLIRKFLRVKLFPMASIDNDSAGEAPIPLLEDQIIKVIIEEINSNDFPSLDNENERENPFKESWVTCKKKWMLSENQKKIIDSLSPSAIYAELDTFLHKYITNLVSNNFTKKYRILVLLDNYSDQEYGHNYGIRWLKKVLEYNIRSLKTTIKITTIGLEDGVISSDFILKGAGIGVFEAIRHSDINCKPRIISSSDLVLSPSVFLHSKPDAIINLDISLGSTLFTCSILDGDGLVQQIFDHDRCIGDKHLSPLGHFFTFSGTTTLNVKKQFIPFAKRYLLGDLSDLIADDSAPMKKDLLFEMKALLTKDDSKGEAFVSTDKQKYIKAFILMYMIYIKEEILYNFSKQLLFNLMDMKIGYDVSIEAILLNNTMNSKANLRNIIYASGLVLKNGHSKKLRITTQGETVLPAIQKSLKLKLSLKSFFLVSQLQEDYVQLSLHQVVTESSWEEKEQESIIVRDEILVIQNIYDSLCSNIWHNLLQYNRLIKLCEMHNTGDNNKILDLFSSKVKSEFFANLKSHISDNVLQNNPGMRNTYLVNLTSSCNCKVHLTTADIIDISFTPVLQDIARTLSASLSNKELFGNYMDVDYIFSFIRFNNNTQLQYAFARILEEEVNRSNLELGIDIPCLVIPELFSQLVQPVIRRQPLCYEDFKIGALQQVCSENYVASIIRDANEDARPIYKSKMTDTGNIGYKGDIAFPFLNKGAIIYNVRLNRKLYLKNKEVWFVPVFSLDVHRFKTLDDLVNNESLPSKDINSQYDRNIGSDFRHPDASIPVMLSVNYVAYVSSLQFSAKVVGGEEKKDVIEIHEPLTLARF